MKKYFHKVALILCLFLCTLSYVHGNEETFYVEEIKTDGSTSLLDQAESYEAAKASYDAHVANTNNIQIRQGDTVWKMKYGVVLFHTSDTCDYNVTYLSENGNGYVNGCYGIDAAYVGSTNPGYLDFYISGIYGSTTGDDVTLMPIETAKQVSDYRVEEGKLYHQIKTDMTHQTYSSLIYLGEAPDYLKDKSEYYSYDGHYFYPASEDYSGFHQMIDDLNNKTHTHAVNTADPFYQYYQYLSHRSETSYSENDLENYFSDYLQIKGPLTSYRSIQTSYHAILTQSLLKGSAAAFLQYQNEFGANALMMLALSMNESAMGRSYLAYTRNNLFGHAAFDSAVEENASRYHSVDASIYSHAYHYLHKGYVDPDNYVWHGGYFGNKASGMNVMYASDPYWGEKAAQYCTRLDEALGNKDLKQYPLGIIKGDHMVSFYKEADDSEAALYHTHGLKDFAVVILNETSDYYQIQSEPALAQTHGYDFDLDVAYVKKSDIDIVSQPIEAKAVKRHTVTFDAKDGKFENQSSKLQFNLKEGQTPAVVAPVKAGWLFMGWDKEIQPVTQSVTYTAQYEQITDASLSKLPKQKYELEEQLDVSGGMLDITLAQGEHRQIPLNSAMVSGFDNEKSSKQTIHVTYQGVSVDYEIEFQAAKQKQKSELSKQIEALLEKINPNEPFSEANENEILALKEKLDQQGTADFSIGSYRSFDTYIQKAYGSALRTMVHDDDSGISVSGLSVAVALNKPSLFPQTIHLSFSKGIDDEAEALLKKVAEGNGYTADYCFNLNIKHGSTPVTPQEKLIYTLPVKNDSNVNRQYTLLAYEENEVVQIPVEQASNQIRFLTDHVGDFALVYRNSASAYEIDEVRENNSADTNPHSLWDYLLWIIAAVLMIAIGLIVILIVKRKQKQTGTKDHPKKAFRRKRKQKSEQPKPQPQPEIEVISSAKEEEEEELIHYFRNDE